MCGIVGLISKNQFGFYTADVAMFTWMLRFDSIRGVDSTGVFGVDKHGNIDTLKGDADGFTFTSCSNYEEYAKRMNSDYRIVIGHNRSATKGTITPHNAHPFQEGPITLVHNGTILNQKDLNAAVEVDSHAIAHGLAEHDAATALGKIDGAFALVWYNSEDKTLSVARNSERPLWLVETPSLWVLSSEIGLAKWMIRRAATNITIKAHKMFEEGKIFTFPLDDLEADPVESTYTKYARYTKPFSSMGVSWGRMVPAVSQHAPRLLTSKNSATLPFGGESIIITIDDDKELSSGNPGRRVYLGTMVDAKTGEQIPHVITRFVLPGHMSDEAAQQFDEMAMSHKYFSAVVSNIAYSQHVRVLNVRDVAPYELVKTKRGDVYSKQELQTILMRGCPRCKTAIPVEEAPETIVARVEDGTHRILCQTCIQEAITNARSNVSAS